jgi:hypothetical protein
MRILSSAAFAVSVLICSTACAQGAKEVADARAATEQWLKLMDTEEYNAAWTKSAEGVRKEMPKLAWNMLATATHLPLGTLNKRTYQSASIKPARITFAYRSDYEKSHAVSETITTVLEADGVWRVSGYSINGDANK